MNRDVRAMLESMYQAFCEQAHDKELAWDRFLEFIAADHRPNLFWQLNHRFEWLFEDSGLVRKLEQTYQPILLQSDYYDHLGDMYAEHVLKPTEANIEASKLIPYDLAEVMAKQAVAEDERPQYIIDVAAGTGRLLMTVHQYAPKAHLFGVESDLRLLRIALTNFAIHRTYVCLLQADSRTHEIDIAQEDGRYNWKFANNWYSCIDQLKPTTLRSTLKPKPNGSR